MRGREVSGGDNRQVSEPIYMLSIFVAFQFCFSYSDYVRITETKTKYYHHFIMYLIPGQEFHYGKKGDWFASKLFRCLNTLKFELQLTHASQARPCFYEGETTFQGETFSNHNEGTQLQTGFQPIIIQEHRDRPALRPITSRHLNANTRTILFIWPVALMAPLTCA